MLLSAADYAIRRAGASDAAGLAALEARCFPGGQMSLASFRRHIVSPRAVILVAIAGRGEVLLAGYAMILIRADSAAARLYGLAVQPQLRRAGIGERLLRAAERAARRLGAAELRLEVRLANRPARRLYQKRGYGALGSIRGYYADGSDALRLARALQSPCRRHKRRIRGGD